jgi:IrrE N-terminal-like domain
MIWLRPYLLAALAVLATRAAMSEALAQATPAQARAQHLTACGNTIDAAMKKLRPHLGDFPALRDKKDLVLLMPAANFNAFADYDQQRILIPVMLCVETWYLLDGYMQMYRQPKLRTALQRYALYLSKRQQDSLASGTGFDNIPILPFHEFAGVAYPQLTDAEGRKSLAVHEGMMVDSIAFVIGHELGHLVLRHKPYNKISPEAARKQEAEADEFGARLVSKSGISVIGALPVIQRFLANESLYKAFSGSPATHPRPECRMERILSSTGEIQELLKNPARRREYEAGSGLSANDFANTMKEVREDCESNSSGGGTHLVQIINATKNSFQSLRIGPAQEIDGERYWRATVSLKGDIPCTVWSGSSDLNPRITCQFGTTMDERLAQQHYSEAVDLVQITVPSDWKRTDRETGTSAKSKYVVYNGPGVRIRIAMNWVERTGVYRVNVSVQATQ